MTNTNYNTRILLNKSATEVFNAIMNVSGWWQGEINGNTEKSGDVFTYRMKEFHFSEQKIIDIIPNKKIVWLVTDSQLNFIKQKDEWTGTKIIFEISEMDNQTELLFTHEGLNPAIECYNDCSNGWEKLITESLYSLIMTGKGKNVF